VKEVPNDPESGNFTDPPTCFGFSLAERTGRA
jgi:hypothetical protein